MAYPPVPYRHENFRQDENAGQQINTSALDAEFNSLVEILGQVVSKLQLITNSDGTLSGASTAIAAALAGANRFVATAAQTVFLTTVTWDAAFSNLSVPVYVQGVKQDSNTVAVANSAGFLQVTLTPATPLVAGQIVFVEAFTPSAGLVTRLADTGSGANGANMVGVQDVGNLYSGTTVETCLAEVRTVLDGLIVDLGVTADLWTNQGLTRGGGQATDDFQLGGFRVTNMADGTAATDAVTVQQVQTLTQGISDLLNLFIRADGSLDFTADQSMGGHKLVDVATATNPTDALNLAAMTTHMADPSGHPIVTALAPGFVPTLSGSVNDAFRGDGTYGPVASFPAGTFMWYSAPQGTPAGGWIYADGVPVSRVTYATLFAAYCPSQAVSLVDTGGDGLIFAAAHELHTGELFRITTTGTLPAPLAINTDYFVIEVDSVTIKLATSLANALAGTAINITTTGSGTHTIQLFPYGAGDGSTTFGIPLMARRVIVGDGGTPTTALGNALGVTGGEETHALVTAELASHKHVQNISRVSGGVTTTINQIETTGATGGGSGFSSTIAQDTGSNTIVGDMSTDLTGSGTGHNTIQPSIIMRGFIKT